MMQLQIRSYLDFFHSSPPSSATQQAGRSQKQAALAATTAYKHRARVTRAA